LLCDKVFPRFGAASDQFERGVAVVQEDDAVVFQVADGVLDVMDDLLIGVQPVDQCDVDGALGEKGCLVRKERVTRAFESASWRVLFETLNTGSTAIFWSALMRRNACPFETPISRYTGLTRPSSARCTALIRFAPGRASANTTSPSLKFTRRSSLPSGSPTMGLLNACVIMPRLEDPVL
jgi:hypothetical protein